MPESSLSKADRELIFDLAHKLTGTAEVPTTRHEILITNVLRRMQAVAKLTLASYLNYVSQNEGELAHLISAVTIHTTSWFREMPHYKRLEKNLNLNPTKFKEHKLRLLSAASSTGEELYSFGMVLENFRKKHPDFDYELVGFDVDPICVQRADTGYYQINDLSSIPELYRRFLIKGKNSTGSYLIDPEIRRRTRFHVGNLLDSDSFIQDPFDIVVCRNCLIYFSDEKIHKIVSNLLSVLRPDGHLTIGHSESIDARNFKLNALGESTYKRIDQVSPLQQSRQKPITILAIDDSSWTRLWLSTTLASYGIKVITADSAESANEILERNSCDLITLELNLPGQSGLAWLTDQRRKGLSVPVIILTDVKSAQAPEILEALSGKSQDYVNKSEISNQPLDFIDKIQGLVNAKRNKEGIRHQPLRVSDLKTSELKSHLRRPDVILAGASTGGTDALCTLLSDLPEDCPPVVCVQHIPTEFAQAFLERLARSSKLKPATPEKGKELLKGHIYLPIQDAHIGIRQSGSKLNAYYSYDEKVSSHRPSVDFLFQSASQLRSKSVLAFLLTGMGRDGAQGLLDLKNAGAFTLAQDERSSVVWGMPGEAVKLGAPMIIGSLTELREALQEALRSPTKKAG